MPDLAVVERRVSAFQASRAHLDERVTAAVLAQMDGFDGWATPSLLGELVDAVSARVSAGQVGVAQLTDAYLAQVTSEMTGRIVSPAGVPAGIGETQRRGVAGHAEVYNRLGTQFRTQVAAGATRTEAFTSTVNRAKAMVGTDLGLAHRAQVRQFTERRGVTRYRRVFSGANTCGLCVAASDRLYHKTDLLPLHDNCRCATVPVTAGTDPGSQINQAQLDDLYKQAGSTGAKDLHKVRYNVVDHAEKGPTLVVRGQHWRSPADVAAA